MLELPSRDARQAGHGDDPMTVDRSIIRIDAWAHKNTHGCAEERLFTLNGHHAKRASCRCTTPQQWL
jgi:hypothetical protein